MYSDGGVDSGEARVGAELAPGSEATLRQLRQTPAVPRDPIPPEILHDDPARAFVLDEDKFSPISDHPAEGRLVDRLG